MAFICHDCRTEHQATSAWSAPTRCRFCNGGRIEEGPVPTVRAPIIHRPLGGGRAR